MGHVLSRLSSCQPQNMPSTRSKTKKTDANDASYITSVKQKRRRTSTKCDDVSSNLSTEGKGINFG